jgi:hypothetical protein
MGFICSPVSKAEATAVPSSCLSPRGRDGAPSYTLWRPLIGPDFVRCSSLDQSGMGNEHDHIPQKWLLGTQLCHLVAGDGKCCSPGRAPALNPRGAHAQGSRVSPWGRVKHKLWTQRPLLHTSPRCCATEWWGQASYALQAPVSSPTGWK